MSDPTSASHPEDLCPEPYELAETGRPLAPPIYPSAVYRCRDTREAEALLSGERPGYAYRRDGQPNADALSGRLAQLHGAAWAAVFSSGMAALAGAALATLKTGDSLVVGNRAYGKSLVLLCGEMNRLGISATAVDTCDAAATEEAFDEQTRLLVVETISNPQLRVADVAALAEVAHRRGALLLVDNTFAGPSLCRPLEHGADLVVESLTKIINGHSDVLLGALCGNEKAGSLASRAREVLSAYGASPSPWDCWLAARGMGTLALRSEKACQNALAVARWLGGQSVSGVRYPGLEDHPDHRLAARQLSGRFGTVVSFDLPDVAAAERFITATPIPFCPSLGDLSTTLMHPASTSHRSLSEEELRRLDISEGTIRLSVGVESPEFIVEALREGLAIQA